MSVCNLFYKIDNIIRTNNLSNIPDILVNCLIVAEDHRFEKHCGVDAIAILRATYRTLFCSRVEGASTIAMQLVRTLTSNRGINIARKLGEMYLAFRVTKRFSREEIAKVYLLVAYYGWNLHSLFDVSKYIGIEDIENISLESSAQIVARLKYPEPKGYNINKIQKIRTRTKYIKNKYLGVV